MIVLEAKLQGSSDQYQVIDEMIRTGRFVRNACLRYWMDNRDVGRLDLNKYCKVLSDNILEFPWVSKLNSMARQAMAERALASFSAVARRKAIAASGRRLRDFLITVGRRFKEKRDTLNSSGIKPVTQLSIKQVDGDYQRIEGILPSQMGLKLALLRCGVHAICTITR